MPTSPTMIGDFERKARERALRDGLWRCLYVARGACAPDDVVWDYAFDNAMAREKELYQEAVALGFSGRREWVEELCNAHLDILEARSDQ
jgi:hypothetical protein